MLHRMAPGKDKDRKDKERKAARPEYEVAYYTKELGRPLQRKLLQKRLNDLSDSAVSSASHGEDVSTDTPGATPPEDRAG